jgi:hypothetical protein
MKFNNDLNEISLYAEYSNVEIRLILLQHNKSKETLVFQIGISFETQ